MLRRVSVAVNVLRNNSFLGELQGIADNPPSIKMEDSANIKTVLQGTFKKKVLDRWKHYVNFNPLTDALQPVLTINGIHHILGIFLPATVTPAYSDNATEETLDIEAYDRCWLPATTTGTERIFFRRGTAYLDAVEQLLAASGIALIDSVPCSEVLSEDREDWDLGTDYLTIINDLLREINYKQLWFDSSGTAILEPIETPTVESIKHRLDTRDATTLVRPGLSRKMDIYSTPNVFICTCDNPEKSAVLTAVARNDNEHSQLSIQKRGREIVYYENVNNIASQDALQQYADRLLFNSLMTGEMLEVTTNLLPGWGIGDVVALHYLDVNALCISRSWSMSLAAGGTMKHTFETLVYNLKDEEEEKLIESEEYHFIYDDPYDDDENDEIADGNNAIDESDDDNNPTTDESDGESNLPDEIRIDTMPNKMTYMDDGEVEGIDITGIIVKAYKDNQIWSSDDYPDGIIPIIELSAQYSSPMYGWESYLPIFVSWHRPYDNAALTTSYNANLMVLPNKMSARWKQHSTGFSIVNYIDGEVPDLDDLNVWAERDGPGWVNIEYQNPIPTGELTIMRTNRVLKDTYIPSDYEIAPFTRPIAYEHEVHATYRLRRNNGTGPFVFSVDYTSSNSDTRCIASEHPSDFFGYDDSIVRDHEINVFMASKYPGTCTIGDTTYDLDPLFESDYMLRQRGGKQIYHALFNFGIEKDYSMLEMTPEPVHYSNEDAVGFSEMVCWSLFYDSVKIYTDTYTISWQRPGDGKVLTTMIDVETREAIEIAE